MGCHSKLGHHLRALERGGLIRSAKKGRVRSVSVNAKAVADVERWIASRRRNLERRLDRLQHFLATRKTGEAEEMSTRSVVHDTITVERLLAEVKPRSSSMRGRTPRCGRSGTIPVRSSSSPS